MNDEIRELLEDCISALSDASYELCEVFDSQGAPEPLNYSNIHDVYAAAEKAEERALNYLKALNTGENDGE